MAGLILGFEADLVLGRRRPTTRRAWPLHARIGNAVLAHRLRRRTGAALHDLGPMRAARRTALLSLGLRERRFGYPLEMVTAAADAGWRIAEVDVRYAPRTAGSRSKVTGTAAGTLCAVRDMSPGADPMTSQLLVIAKAPVPGRVKTRLCPPCTPHQAARLAAEALTDTLAAVRATPAARRVLVAIWLGMRALAAVSALSRRR